MVWGWLDRLMAWAKQRIALLEEQWRAGNRFQILLEYHPEVLVQELGNEESLVRWDLEPWMRRWLLEMAQQRVQARQGQSVS